MAAKSEEYQIVLQYKRVGEKSTGSICLSSVSTGDASILFTSFEDEDFTRVLNHLARAISSYPSAQVVFMRTDHSHLRPFVLDQETVDLFIGDPVAAIQSMTFVVDKPEPKSGVSIIPSFRAGYDTLAEAFGEDAYLLVRRNGIDCPGCGCWGMFRQEGDGTATFSCRHCPKHVMAKPLALQLHGKWASLPMSSLLSLPLDRFYLPCAWHGGLWITWQSLEEKYRAYLLEKESSCFSLPLPDSTASS